MALCLLGFRGSGYSPSFVRAMTDLQGRLGAHPQTPLRLVDRPDAICAACPHLAASGCTLGGAAHEAHMGAHDREVLRRLGLAPNTETSWAAVLERIAATIAGADLPAICTTCPWLPLGVCARSVDALRTGRRPPAEAH